MTVIYARQLPAHQATRARAAAARARESSAAARKTEIADKPFQNMTPAEKDKLLHVLALQAGLISS
jgi:hypothetical protein